MEIKPEISTDDKAKAFDALCEMLSIGRAAQTPSVLIHNVSNLLRFSEQQQAVELKYFMVAGEPDEYEPSEEPADECLLNRWGSTTEEYVAQFEAALMEIEPFKTLVAENTKLTEQRAKLQDLLRTYASEFSEVNPYVVEALNFGAE